VEQQQRETQREAAAGAGEGAVAAARRARGKYRSYGDLHKTVAERYLKRWKTVEKARAELLADFPIQFSNGLPHHFFLPVSRRFGAFLPVTKPVSPELRGLRPRHQQVAVRYYTFTI
jgi:hypothetical protein